MKIGVSLPIAGLSLFLLGSTAMATPPECHSGVGKRFYDNAYESRTRQLRDFWRWDYYSDCTYQVEFEMIYANDFLQERGPTVRKCRNAGRNAATEKVINEISNQCTYQGAKHGGEDGAFFAREYCGVFSAAMYIEGNYVPAYEESCSASFIHVAQELCPDKVEADYYFHDTVREECELY